MGLLYKLSLEGQVVCVLEVEKSHARGPYLNKNDMVV